MTSAKSTRNYEKKILCTADAWLMNHLSHWPSEPAYCIVDFMCHPSKLKYSDFFVMVSISKKYKLMSEPLDGEKDSLSLSYCGVKHRHPKVDKDGLER